MQRPSLFSRLVLALTTLVAADQIAKADDDPLAAWRDHARISVVSPQDGRHTIHSYYTTCPESPDGRKVIFFASRTPQGELGDVVLRDRISGEEKALVTNLKVEDAHRVACQQWVSNGSRVVFHGQRGEEWFVGCVDLDTMKERVLATEQLAGWGQPDSDVVPLYGMHWNPGKHRGLDLVNVVTGEKHTVLEVDALEDYQL